MITLLLGAGALAAVIAVAVRQLRAAAQARRRPGASIDRAVLVRRFDEIDDAVRGRRCACGGIMDLAGETSTSIGDRRFRIVRLVCRECERDDLVHFDVTAVFH